jgi:predicted CoA-substrate-specific enzyme activase
MPCYCGVDIGASAAKLVLIDEACRVLAKTVRRSGIDYAAAATQSLDEAFRAAGMPAAKPAASCSTGYGRDNVPWSDGKATEIACHGRGAFHHFRRAMTVIDIGAQDSKVIHLDDAGRRTGFKMNRKCAAGTGAFLEEMALRLDIPLESMDGLARQSTEMVKLGSYCTVFSATEVLENIRYGKKVTDIVKGLFYSVIKRVLEMDSVTECVVMTGGVVAHNPYLVTMTEEMIGRPVLTPPLPQLAGAVGAALYAKDMKR